MIITLDCDGTVFMGNPPGPVSKGLILSWLGKGYRVFMISDSGNCASIVGLGVVRIPAQSQCRHAVVSALQVLYPTEVVVYIDDNPANESVCRGSIDPGRCRFVLASQVVALAL